MSSLVYIWGPFEPWHGLFPLRLGCEHGERVAFFGIWIKFENNLKRLPHFVYDMMPHHAQLMRTGLFAVCQNRFRVV